MRSAELVLSELAIVPAELRGVIAEIKMLIEFQSGRAANLVARLAAANKRAELLLACIRGLESGMARAADERIEAPP